MPNTTTPDSLEDIRDRVLKVIATTKRLPRANVTPESTFESLGIDSLDRLNILFDLESEFDIEINDEDAKRVENIEQMVAGVAQLVDAKTAGISPGSLASQPAAAEASVELQPDQSSAESQSEGHTAPAVTKSTSSVE